MSSDEINSYCEFVERAKASRLQHTAGRRCFVLLKALEAAAHKAFPNSGPDFFGSALFNPLWSGDHVDVTGDDAVAGFLWDDLPEGDEPPPLAFKALLIATAYAVEAIKAEQAEGQTGRAWDLAFDAAQWEGFLSGLTAGGDEEKAEDAFETLRNSKWVLNKPERDDVAAGVLYRTLMPIHEAGEPRPTPRQVFTMWLENKPMEFTHITAAEFGFINARDEEQTVSFENFEGRFKRMTRPKKGAIRGR